MKKSEEIYNEIFSFKIYILKENQINSFIYIQLYYHNLAENLKYFQKSVHFCNYQFLRNQRQNMSTFAPKNEFSNLISRCSLSTGTALSKENSIGSRET